MRGGPLALLLIAASATVVPATPASESPSTTGSGSIGIRLLAVPGASPGDGLASSYVVDRLAPGARLARSVEIDNDTNSVARVSVYAAGAHVAKGSFRFASGRSQDELSSWTSVNHPVLDMEPKTNASDTLTIKVPGSASGGEDYAVIWAEISAPSTAKGITLSNRVGIRMYVSIGPGGAPQPKFAIGSLVAKRSPTGQALVVSTVHNLGLSTLAINGDLTLSKGPDGLRAGPFAVTVETVLAPGFSEPVTIHLDGAIPSGPWQADLQLTSGSVQHSAVATIIFPAKPAIGFPTLVLAIVLLIILLAVTALALLASRRRTPKTR